jgi:hypothetical protein
MAKSLQHIVGVSEVDYDHLVLFVDFFSNADEMVGLEV